MLPLHYRRDDLRSWYSVIKQAEIDKSHGFAVTVELHLIWGFYGDNHGHYVQDMTPCSLVDTPRCRMGEEEATRERRYCCKGKDRAEGTLLGNDPSKEQHPHYSYWCLSIASVPVFMKMVAAGSSETLLTVHQITQRDVTEGSSTLCWITVKYVMKGLKGRPVARNNACKVASGHMQYRDAVWIAARKVTTEESWGWIDESALGTNVSLLLCRGHHATGNATMVGGGLGAGVKLPVLASKCNAD